MAKKKWSELTRNQQRVILSGDFHLITGMLHLFGFNLIPTHPLPLALSPLTGAFQRIEDTFGVLDLVDGRGSLGAITTPAGWMVGISLHAPNRPVLLVDESEAAICGCSEVIFSCAIKRSC